MDIVKNIYFTIETCIESLPLATAIVKCWFVFSPSSKNIYDNNQLSISNNCDIIINRSKRKR